ncbi:hypothetical protein Bca4012_056542 [Brassica carinata]
MVEQVEHGVYISLAALVCCVRHPQTCPFQLGTGETVVARTEEESTSSTMYEWLTKPVWKCFFGTL